MRELADGLFLLRGFPPNAINVYLIGDVLVDAASRHARRRILRQLRGRTVRAHALTHGHPDHHGSSGAVCEALGVPFWVGEHDVEAVEEPRLMVERHPNATNRAVAALLGGPAHRVDRALRDGDEVGGFEVLDVPGHSRGHVAYWRESDRALVLGDVLNGMNVRTGIPGLNEPPGVFTEDPELNRASARRLASLEPRLVCFGHGAPLRDTRRFVEFVERLPA